MLRCDKVCVDKGTYTHGITFVMNTPNAHTHTFPVQHTRTQTYTHTPSTYTQKHTFSIQYRTWLGIQCHSLHSVIGTFSLNDFTTALQLLEIQLRGECEWGVCVWSVGGECWCEWGVWVWVCCAALIRTRMVSTCTKVKPRSNLNNTSPLHTVTLPS